MNINLRTEGLFHRDQLESWVLSRQLAINKAVGDGMRAFVPGVKAAVRTQAQQGLKIKKRQFLQTFSAKVFDRKPRVLPVMYVYNATRWAGIHEHGGTIRGPLLIPLLGDKRIGRKAFRRIVTDLLRTGNAFFKQVNGKTILFAENIRENSRGLSGFKRAERTRSGAKRIKRGQEVPIAVLVPRVTLKKRLRIGDTVRREVPRLAALIQTRLNS